MRKTYFLRVSAATVLLLSVAAATVPYVTSYVSSSAVVNAPILPVSAPFNGVVTTPTGGVATPVLEGDTFLILKNSRNQEEQLRTNRTTLGALSGEISGLEKQLRDLKKLRAELLLRRQAHLEARMTWFGPRLEEAGAMVRRSSASLMRARDRADRIAKLIERGNTTQLDAIDAEASLLEAEADLAQAQSLLDRLMVERDTLRGDGGLDLTSNGLEQIEYRLDEISVRAADINARLLTKQARRAALKTQISALSLDVIRQKTFSPSVPASGIVWEASGKAGSSVVDGEQIAMILDCSRRFLEVVLAERHFESITPGTGATVRFKGASDSFSAVVAAVYGSGARPNRRMQAASPRINLSNGLRVIVLLGPADVTDSKVARSFCDVGRAAEVRFDLPEDNIVARIAQAAASIFPSRSTSLAESASAAGSATEKN